MLIVIPSRLIARSPLLYALTLLPDCRSAYSYTSPRDPLTHPGRREERREGKWDVQITKAVVIEERPHVLSGDVGAGRCPVVPPLFRCCCSTHNAQTAMAHCRTPCHARGSHLDGWTRGRHNETLSQAHNLLGLPMYTQAVHRAEALRPWCVVHWQKHCPLVLGAGRSRRPL